MLESRHQFRDELKELERETLGGIDLVVGQLDRALESVTYRDVELAGMVVADDDRVDVAVPGDSPGCAVVARPSSARRR